MTRKPEDPLNVIAKTEYLKQNLNPKWAPLELSVETCGGLDSVLTLRVYDWDADGGHVCDLFLFFTI